MLNARIECRFNLGDNTIKKCRKSECLALGQNDEQISSYPPNRYDADAEAQYERDLLLRRKVDLEEMDGEEYFFFFLESEFCLRSPVDEYPSIRDSHWRECQNNSGIQRFC
jgi:hypothetical protein